MMEKTHLSDEELLLIADGEIPAGRADEAREHLGTCARCCARLGEIQLLSVELARVQRETVNISPADGPRANLRARLAESAKKWDWASWNRYEAYLFASRPWAYALGLLLLALLGLRVLTHEARTSESPEAVDSHDAGPLLPEANLTPGVTRAIDVSETCTAGPADQMATIPLAERKAVFKEYGMDASRSRQFEVDHLITPELGGTDDIRNLWPEPYASTEWNAYVKDELEDRLRRLVCERKLDLATAQHDIATNWISAYREYFHTDKPLANVSRVAWDEKREPTE